MDPARIYPFPNGNVIRLWHDDALTADEIRAFSPHDADAWPEWADFWHRAVRILSAYYLTPPPSLAQFVGQVPRGGRREASGDPADRPASGPHRPVLRIG